VSVTRAAALALLALAAWTALVALDQRTHRMGDGDWRTGPTPSAECHESNDRCAACHGRGR
jgi:hypothetical protein